MHALGPVLLQWSDAVTRIPLFQVMACPLFHTKPLPAMMLNICDVDLQ